MDSNKADSIVEIALSIDRIAGLYQIPDWSPKKSADLGEWIYENFLYEPLDLILRVLRNPPCTEEPNWRLTPDTIFRWMKPELEKRSIRLQKEQEKIEQESASIKIDYVAFAKRIEKEGLPAPDMRNQDYNTPAYQEWRKKWVKKRESEAGNTASGTNQEA